MPKRLNTRLQSLEAATGSGSDLVHDDRRLLVGLLGRRDALFWPWRWTQTIRDQFPELMARQREYLSGVAGLPVKAAGKADWKTSSDRRQRLIDGGLLTATHSGGQVTTVFLAPKGEAVARSLVSWVATFGESLPVLRRMISLSGGKPNVPIRESMLWEHSCVGNPQDWNARTEMILPAITAGVVRASSDTGGRIAYSLTPPAWPARVDVDEPAAEWAADYYLEVFNASRASLESVEPRNGLEVWIPLPATGWGEHYREGQADASV